MIATKLAEVIPGWSTTGQVAEFLGISPQYVRRLREELQAVDVGANALLYPSRSVREFAKRPRPKPGWPKGKPRPERAKK